jgi:uncharacterized phage protein (TIGR02218 family)
VKHTAGFAVGNLALTTLNDGSLFTTSDILGGLWRNSKFRLFRYNWADPPTGSPPGPVEEILAGSIGEVKLSEGMVAAELRDLRQYFQHPVGSPSSRTCRYRLGDSNCRVDLGSPNNWTETGTVAAVTTRQQFTASGLGHGGSPSQDDWYTEGELTWLTGANSGIAVKVQGSRSSGVMTLAWAMFADIAASDTFSVVAGCRRRLEEDCRDKFNNVLNFGGEPHRPGVDDLTKPVTFSV